MTQVMQDSDSPQVSICCILQPVHTDKIQINHDLIQNHLPQYKQYFADVQFITDQKILTCNNSTQNKIKHKIITITQENDLSMLIDFNKARIFVVGTQCNGLIVKYQVLLGNFKISVDMINRNIDAPDQIKQIGSGSYGDVFIISTRKGKNIACKRSVFRKKTVIWPQNEQGEELRQAWQIKANISQIQQVILQYSIYRICSFYKIGPSTVDCLEFDLVCFNNAIQFYMQYCGQKIKSNKYQDQLKICVRTLHKMNIIHKDIKPANILYSESQQSYVLTDFGISHPVQQKPGELTQTYKQGTPGYMSFEMVNIGNQKTGLVDLYFNDLFGLKTSIKVLHEQIYDQQIIIKHKYQNYQKKTFNEYVVISLIFMVLNAQTHETVDFIKKYKLQAMIFKQIKFLQKHSIKYKKITEILIINQQSSIKYPSQFKEQTLPWIYNMTIVVEQIQFMVRAYGMTYELINQLSHFKENWRIMNIMNNQNNISMRISTIQQLKVTSKQLWFIKSQEKRLEYLLNFIDENDAQYFNKIVQTSFTIFNFYVQFPIYYEYAENIYKKIAQLPINQFSTEQKIQYQINTIILHLINNKQKNGQSKKRILQLLHTNPRETLLNYKTYFKIICLIHKYTEVVQEYNLFAAIYKQTQFFKSDRDQVKQLIQIKILMASLYSERQQTEKSQTILSQVQQLLQHHTLKIYDIDVRLLRGRNYLKESRLKKALKIFEQLLMFIRQNEGQNSYKILLCKIELGKGYQLVNNLQKSERYLIQCYEQIYQIYGQNNKDFLKCLENLIKLFIKKGYVNKVISLYDQWNAILNKIYPEQNINQLNLIKLVIKFYFKHGLINKIQVIISEVKKKNQGTNSIVDYYSLIIIAYYYWLKEDIKKQLQLRKQLYQKTRLVFKQSNPILQLILLKLYGDCCLDQGKQYYQQAYKKYQFIISHTSKHSIIYIESVYNIGMIYFHNQDYIKAYDYFNSALMLFIEAQNELIYIQLKLKFGLANCLIQMHQYNKALKLLLTIIQTCKTQFPLQFQNYLVQYQIALCYSKLNKINKSIKLLIQLKKRIRLNYPNIKELYLQNSSNKYLNPRVQKRTTQAVSTYQYTLTLLYFLYYQKKMCFHAIYYIEYLGAFTKTKKINIQNESIYTIYYQRYRRKKQKALKFELLYIDNNPETHLCYKHCKLIQFYSKCRAITILLILLTFLLQKVCKCQISRSYLPFYNMLKNGLKYRICNEIVKNGKLNVKNVNEKILEKMKKISLFKKMRFLNRKLRLGHQVESQSKFT